MTLCLMCCPGFSKTTGSSVDAIRVRSGWVAASDGYFLSDSAMRDTVSGWSEARKIAEVRLQALEALRSEIDAQSKETARLLSELQSEIAAERKAYRSRIRGSKFQGLIYGFVIGFGSGYLVRRNNP